MNGANENQGTLEQLTQRVRNLMAESKDPEYTEYLHKMEERIRQQKYQVDLLKSEVDRTYTMYLRRMELNEAKAEAAAETVVMQEPVVEEHVDVEPTVTEQVAAEPDVMESEVASQAVTEEASYFNRIEEPVQQQVPVQTAPQKKRNAEFTIGGAVLSVVGGGFILAALVTLGMTFMGGLFKGICLYGVSLLFLLASELYLYRRWQMMGATFSAIGIGGLYLSTAVNYLGLHNFNLWVTLGFTVAITVFVILLSRKRNSILYRIIGMIAGYLCFFMIQPGITELEFYVVSGLILLMNVLCILMPMQNAKAGIQTAHAAINTFFAICFAIRAIVGCDLELWPVLIFVISSIVVMQMLFVAQYFHYKQNGSDSCGAGFLTVYYISLVCYMFMANLLVAGVVDTYENNWYAYGTAIAVGVIALVSLFALSLRKCSGQGHVYTFLNLTAYFLVGCIGEKWNLVITILVMVALVKLICCKKSDIVYRVNDILITFLLCVALDLHGLEYSYALLAGVVFSILMIRYWQTVYEIGLTAVLVLYAANNLPYNLNLPVIVGLLLVAILLYNNVKRWQGKNILVFNILALIVQGICFLILAGYVYQNEYITYLCMLVFGLATIVLTMQDKYQMNFKGKYLILAIFLTYMAFILRVEIPVINSILLMIIALVCVGVGFAVDKKSVRVYGLVLSLVVCGKLVLYDFFGAATIQKTILFFAVGVLALIIAAIYIILEKKNNT